LARPSVFYKVFYFEFCLQIVGQDTILGCDGAMVTCGELGFSDSHPNCPQVSVIWGWLQYRPKRAAHT